MISTYREFVEEFRLMYNEEIKPLILEGYFENARMSLYNIIISPQIDNSIINEETVISVHNGFNLFASIVDLYSKLGRSDFKPENTGMLEAYLAQTTLPTQEEVMRDLGREGLAR